MAPSRDDEKVNYEGYGRTREGAFLVSLISIQFFCETLQLSGRDGGTRQCAWQ